MNCHPLVIVPMGWTGTLALADVSKREFRVFCNRAPISSIDALLVKTAAGRFPVLIMGDSR